MSKEKIRYSAEDLKEFEELLTKKLTSSRSELTHLKESITRSHSGSDDNFNRIKTW